MDYVDAIRERVGRELVWLDVHKDPNVFSRETVLSPSNEPVSQLWNHVTGQFRARERAGLSQADLGALAGVRRATVIHWELRGAVPRHKTRRKLAEILGG